MQSERGTKCHGTCGSITNQKSAQIFNSTSDYNALIVIIVEHNVFPWTFKEDCVICSMCLLKTPSIKSHLPCSYLKMYIYFCILLPNLMWKIDYYSENRKKA